MITTNYMIYEVENDDFDRVIIRFDGQFGNGSFKGYDLLTLDEAEALATELLGEIRAIKVELDK